MSRPRRPRALSAAAIALAAALGTFVALAACTSSLALAPPSFRKQTLDTAFRSEGVAIFDVDRDGRRDIVTDQFWYRAPDFSAFAIRTPETYDPVQRYSLCDAAFGEDLDGDGFTDLLVVPFPSDAMSWYQNPRGTGLWTPHLVAPALSAGMETPIYVDLFGDGRRVLVMGIEPDPILAWFEPASDPTAPWIPHPISAPRFAAAGHFSHGLGAGDMDGDGRLDVLTSAGWFQQTANRNVWILHAFVFGPDECSSMYARDFDGDGLADVLCPHPHTYGLRWWKQRPDGSFLENVVDDSISQIHALALADLDRDGIPELVGGKTKYAHTFDPGAEDPPKLVYWKIEPGGTFERHDIDDASGVGRQFAVSDLDGDGKPDIAISNKNGLFLFTQR